MYHGTRYKILAGFPVRIFKHEQQAMIKQRARVYPSYCDDLSHCISIIHCPVPCVINVNEVANFWAAAATAAAVALAAVKNTACTCQACSVICKRAITLCPLTATTTLFCQEDKELALSRCCKGKGQSTLKS